MLEGGKLARKIGGNPALAQFELEIMPGAAVEDDKLADGSRLIWRPTATRPRRRRWAVPQDSWAVGGSHGAPKGIDALRAADASIMPVAPRVATSPTTIMIAERIAKAVYATDGDTWRCPDRRNRGARRPRPLARTITGTR